MADRPPFADAMWQTTGRVHFWIDNGSQVAAILVHGHRSMTGIELLCEGDDITHLHGAEVEVVITIRAIEGGGRG